MWFGGDAGLSSWEGFVILILELGTSIPNNIVYSIPCIFHHIHNPLLGACGGNSDFITVQAMGA